MKITEITKQIEQDIKKRLEAFNPKIKSLTHDEMKQIAGLSFEIIARGLEQADNAIKIVKFFQNEKFAILLNRCENIKKLSKKELQEVLQGFSSAFPVVIQASLHFKNYANYHTECANFINNFLVRDAENHPIGRLARDYKTLDGMVKFVNRNNTEEEAGAEEEIEEEEEIGEEEGNEENTFISPIEFITELTVQTLENAKLVKNSLKEHELDFLDKVGNAYMDYRKATLTEEKDERANLYQEIVKLLK